MRWPIASGIVDTVLNNSTVSANSSYLGGVAMASNNKVQMSTDAAAATDIVVGGILRTFDGIIKVATSGGAHRAQGLLVDEDGVLIVEESGTPANYIAGLPVNASGALCVSSIS